MIIKSKAPLRIGLSGGGTDIENFSVKYGGLVINSAINLYVHTVIEEKRNKKIIFESLDLGKKIILKSDLILDIDGKFDIYKSIYNFFIKKFIKKPVSFHLKTYSDVPQGSGLGGSSTMIVSIIKAFAEWFKISLSKYDVAMIAYKIERKDLKLVGGVQDHFSASYGGFNYIEIKKKTNKIKIKPIKISNYMKNELSSKFLLLYTGISRGSEKIIESQISYIDKNQKKSIQAMIKMKKNTKNMRSYLMNDKKVKDIIKILKSNWLYKKKTGKGVSNLSVNKIIEKLYKLKSEAVKISGAGGGGFILIVTPTENIFNIKNNLKFTGISFFNFGFEDRGVHSWIVK